VSRPVDLYPTLIDLCQLPVRDGLEGHSLAPQLKDASAPRPWPAITTHNQDKVQDHFAHGSPLLSTAGQDRNHLNQVRREEVEAAFITPPLAVLHPSPDVLAEAERAGYILARARKVLLGALSALVVARSGDW